MKERTLLQESKLLAKTIFKLERRKIVTVQFQAINADRCSTKMQKDLKFLWFFQNCDYMKVVKSWLKHILLGPKGSIGFQRSGHRIFSKRERLKTECMCLYICWT